jgi:hypothetical protein
MNEQQTVDTFEKILDAMGSSDMRYILKELQEGPPALVPYLASLIRDRVLHRAIEKTSETWRQRGWVKSCPRRS